MPSLILVFDFDRTILDNDSDRAVMDYFNIYSEVEQKVFKEKKQWTNVMDELYNRFTKKQLEEAMDKSFVIQPGVIDLMNEIGKMQKKQQQKGSDDFSSTSTFFPPSVTSVYLVLCTDSNEFFIRHAFEKFFPNTTIDLLHTNPCTWSNQQDGVDVDECDQKMHVRWCEPHGHTCHRCNKAGLPNMCKGLCVERLIEQPPIDDDAVVYFFGDGFNDMCAVAHLRACDSAFVRRDHTLHTKCIASPIVKTPVSVFPNTGKDDQTPKRFEILLKDGIDDANFRGVSRLVPWTDGNDLFVAVKQHLENTVSSLPPLNILSEEENTFRFYSQKVRIPKTLRDTFSSSQIASAKDPSTKNKIDAFADAVEKNLPVSQELVKYGYEGSSKPTKEKMMKAIGNLPWLHGEMAIHRYLDWIIRGTESPIQSVSEDFWASHKMEAINHALPWICSLIVQHETLWNDNNNNNNNNNNSSRQNKAESEESSSLIEECSHLLMHQLQGNIADLCFRSSSDLGNMFEPQLVRDDRSAVAKYLVENVLKNGTNGCVDNVMSTCDVVVDNAGPELAADLLILTCVLAVALRKNNDNGDDDVFVRLIVKDRPYYVSDTCPHDVGVLLESLEKFVNSPLNTKGKAEVVKSFVQIVRQHLASARIRIVAPAWTTKALEFRDLGFDNALFGFFVPKSSTTPSSPWPRATRASNFGESVNEEHNDDDNKNNNSILTFLPKTKFIIVKGDLNYRRLVSDRKWPVDTSFHRVLDESIFRHLPVVAVRTLKCEVLVGIPKDVEEKFNQQDEKKNDPIFGWRVNGQRGAITFAEPRQ